MSAVAYISIGRRHFGMFSANRAGTTAVPVRICEQIPLGDRMVESQHLQKEIFSRTEKENRVESLPSPNSKKFGRLPQL